MSSTSEECVPLKEEYEKCFKKWFKDSLMKESSSNEHPCTDLLEEYRACIMINAKENKLKKEHDIEFKDGGFRVKWEEKDSAVLLFESLAIATKAFEEADFGDSGIKISACKMPQSTKSVSHRKLIPKKQEKSESSAEPKPKKPENNSTDGIKEAVRPKRDTTVARRLIMASLGISGSDSNSRTSSKPEQGTRIAKDKAEIDQIIDSLQKLDVKKKNS